MCLNRLSIPNQPPHPSIHPSHTRAQRERERENCIADSYMRLALFPSWDWVTTFLMGPLKLWPTSQSILISLCVAYEVSPHWAHCVAPMLIIPVILCPVTSKVHSASWPFCQRATGESSQIDGRVSSMGNPVLLLCQFRTFRDACCVLPCLNLFDHPLWLTGLKLSTK